MSCILALPWPAMGLLLLAGLAMVVVAYGYGWCDGSDYAWKKRMKGVFNTKERGQTNVN